MPAWLVRRTFNLTCVSVLIVTYNPGDTILACLRAVLDSNLPYDVETIVIDNASRDGTVNRVRDAFPDVMVIANSDNLGYGRGNNRGFAQSSGDVIVILNPDAVVTGNALDVMVDYVSTHPDVGIVGPRTYDSDGKVTITARLSYTVPRLLVKHLGLDRLLPSLVYGRLGRISVSTDHPTDADWLSGSALALRREVYEKLGGFDNDLFLFMEDVDLCARVKELGLRVVYLPSAKVVHIGSESVNRFPVARIRSYHLSPLHYFRKRGKPWAVRVLKVGFTVELVSKSILRRVQNVIRFDERRREKAQIEWQVIGEMWKY